MPGSRCLLLILLGLLASSVAPARAQQPAYRILVTNDDGVRSPALAAVAQILQAIGDVIVVAPVMNQSGKGHSVDAPTPIAREELTLHNGLRAIGLTATPALTAHVALGSDLASGVDLVVSGINQGANLGYSAYESGTVAAARVAAMRGVPAIAASMVASAVSRDLVFAAEEVLGVARRVKQYGLAPNTFLNVNVPPRPSDGYRGYRVTSQAGQAVTDVRFAARTDGAGRTFYVSVADGSRAPAPGTDLRAVLDGFVSVTPMVVGETDDAQVETLRAVFE